MAKVAIRDALVISVCITIVGGIALTVFALLMMDSLWGYFHQVK